MSTGRTSIDVVALLILPLARLGLLKRVHYVGERGCEDGMVGSLVNGSEKAKVVILLQSGRRFPLVRGRYDAGKAEGTWHFPEGA
jgi:hypothetical protein